MHCWRSTNRGYILQRLFQCFNSHCIHDCVSCRVSGVYFAKSINSFKCECIFSIAIIHSQCRLNVIIKMQISKFNVWYDDIPCHSSNFWKYEIYVKHVQIILVRIWLVSYICDLVCERDETTFYTYSYSERVRSANDCGSRPLKEYTIFNVLILAVMLLDWSHSFISFTSHAAKFKQTPHLSK